MLGVVVPRAKGAGRGGAERACGLRGAARGLLPPHGGGLPAPRKVCLGPRVSSALTDPERDGRGRTVLLLSSAVVMYQGECVCVCV